MLRPCRQPSAGYPRQVPALVDFHSFRRPPPAGCTASSGSAPRPSQRHLARWRRLNPCQKTTAPACGKTPRPVIGGAVTRASILQSRRPAQRAPDAATAAGWGDKPPPRRMVLRRWRPMHRATLCGFADVELTNGLHIDDFAVRVGDGQACASLPARPTLDQDGRQILRDGKAAVRGDPALAHTRPRRPFLHCGG
jgi:hypothetical protein